MIEPTQTKCGYRFCLFCVKYYIENNSNFCPGCHEIIYSSESHLICDKAIDKEINKLYVKCINENCHEILIFKDLKKHLEICKYQDEKCEKCYELYPYGTRIHHLNEKCKNALILCKDCGNEYLREYIETTHRNLTGNDFEGLCEKLSIDCPNHCQLNDKVNIKNHLKICPMQPIPCIMSNFGCKSIVIRDKMDDHIKDDFRSHLILLNETRKEVLSKTVKTNTNFEIENKQQRNVIDNLRVEINHLRNENKRLITELENINNNIAINESSIKINENPNLIWNITDIIEKIKLAKSDKDLVIYSDEFYTGHPGYKMRMKAYPNGDGIVKGEYFSLYFVIMKGEYDDLISWPFKKIITFCLMIESNVIMKIKMKPDDNESCYGKPINEYNLGAGQPKFLKHDELMLKSKYSLSTLLIQMTVNDRNQ